MGSGPEAMRCKNPKGFARMFLKEPFELRLKKTVKPPVRGPVEGFDILREIA